MFSDDLLKYVPHLWTFALDQLFCCFNSCCKSSQFQLPEHKRFEQFQRHLFRKAALVQTQRGANHNDGTSRIIHAFAKKVLTNRPCLPLIMSANDLSGRLFVPVIALPRLPLSRSASTASCNIRFSLRTMMSGAFRSNSRFSRLFRLMTRRYKSFKSEVANRPPSSGTNGRSSGGNTGNTFNTIHSGLFPTPGKLPSASDVWTAF